MANAFFRARETALDPKERILNDPHAVDLIRNIWKLRILWLLRLVVPGLGLLFEQLQTVHCVRHAAVDALVQQSLSQGVRQIVLLGAGLDARAERLGAAYPDARWFEVDRSPFIGHKHDVLAQAKKRVIPVTADLSRPDWTQKVLDAGLDRQQPTLWVAEGLIHYLPPGTLAKLLQDLHTLTVRPQLAITFIRPEVAAAASSHLRQVIRLVSEIPDVYFSAENLQSLARETHWHAVQTWDFDQQVQAFAPTAQSRPHGVSQDVALFSLASG